MSSDDSASTTSSSSGKGVLGAVGGPGNGLLGLAGSSITHNYSLASGFTKTISTSLLTDFRFGYFKYNPQTQKPDGGTPMSDFGIPNANTSDPKTAGLGASCSARIRSAVKVALQTVAAKAALFPVSETVWVWDAAIARSPKASSSSSSLTTGPRLKGNHQIKFGGDIRYAMNLRIPSDNNRTGEYNFSPEATSNGGAGGLDLASFLLGHVTSFARYVNNPDLPGANNAAERQKRWFFYGQDTWRVTSKLTLNYGLRWEIYFPETVNAKGNGGFANIIDNGGTGAIRVAGFGKIGLNGNVDNTLTAFAPRLGIAYQLTPKTVVRMGYGRSYDIGVFGSNFGHTVTQNLPVLLKQNVNATNFNPLAAGDKVKVFLLDDGPIAATFPAVPSDGIIPFSARWAARSRARTSVPPKQVLPLVDSWNATVQHQLTNTVSVEVAYVGSKGTHGFAGNGPNYDVNPVSIVNFNAINPVTGVTIRRTSEDRCADQKTRWEIAPRSRSIWATSTATMRRATTTRSKRRWRSGSTMACSSFLTTPSRMPTDIPMATTRSVIRLRRDRLTSIATTYSCSTRFMNCPSAKARNTWATQAGPWTMSWADGS